MTNFDVGSLLVTLSGLTIILVSLTVTACKASTQAPCQDVLKPEVLLLHVVLTAYFHWQC